jgi:DNA mismatch repair protein MutS
MTPSRAIDSKSKAVTPMIRQYLDTKQKYPEAILLFRMGDFYEMFFEDAILASKLLDIVLTSRDKGKREPIPMCGVPCHAAHSYIAKLVSQGYKVAICEQIGDPSKIKGLLPRQVTRLITPGTIIDPQNLEAKKSNFLMTIFAESLKESFGIAFLDISTGEFKATKLSTTTSLIAEIARLEPKEILIPAKLEALKIKIKTLFPTIYLNVLSEEQSEPKLAKQTLIQTLSKSQIERIQNKVNDLGLIAAGITVKYALSTQINAPLPIRELIPYNLHDHLILDETVVSHLELVQTTKGERRGSLLDILDQTVTSMGARLLRSWLLYPLINTTEIHSRLSKVKLFFQEGRIRTKIRKILSKMADIERILSRIILKVANPKDLSSLRDSLLLLPNLNNILNSLSHSVLYSSLEERIDECKDIAKILQEALEEDPPHSSKEGGIFKLGWNQELDELRKITISGKEYLLTLERNERKRTGISSLKIRFSKVFGYYIEITKPNLHLVPDEYMRKQTVAGAERFVTKELQEYQAKVLEAEERLKEIEADLFEQLRSQIANKAERIAKLAKKIAEIDVFTALAQVAHQRRYIHPNITNGDTIKIVEGRHPTVEVFKTGAGFVPNDITLNSTSDQMVIITGPNMAGKSTFIRQVALIVIMAQMGSFVPASEAEIGVCDQIFTRVGASDSLITGESTFMVEMQEASNILKQASSRSLIILDEIGRGTSTFDGLSIAWAIAEYIHDIIKARTLFATHYHELIELEKLRPRIKVFNVAAREHNGTITFLYKLTKGGSSRSYGIQVAKIAGIPEIIISRAKEILANLESGELDPEGRIRIAKTKRNPKVQQLGLFAPQVQTSLIETTLKQMNPDKITPLEALKLLYQLKKMQGDKK